jgi:hypothetical protein
MKNLYLKSIFLAMTVMGMGITASPAPESSLARYTRYCDDKVRSAGRYVSNQMRSVADYVGSSSVGQYVNEKTRPFREYVARKEIVVLSKLKLPAWIEKRINRGDYSPAVTQMKEMLNKQGYDYQFSDLFVKASPYDRMIIINYYAENFDSVNEYYLSTILDYRTGLQYDEDILDLYIEKIDAQLLALLRAKGSSLQSTAHMRKNRAGLVKIYKERRELRENKNFIHGVLQKEQELAAQGYFTAYHAQSSDKFVPILLDTFLYELRTKQSLPHFLLMHTKEDAVYEAVRKISKEGKSHAEYLSECAAAEKDILQKHAERRKELLGGVRSDHWYEDTFSVLFMNDSLFGNLKHEGENSYPCYFYRNQNAYTPGLKINNDIKAIFGYHGLEKYAEEFAQEFVQLREEYIKISKYGTLYVLGIPKETIDQNVVYVQPCGYADQCTIQGCATKDMKKIAAALVTDEYVTQKDFKQYVGTMTRDNNGLLNPKSGLKVFPFMIPVDKKQYQEWQAKWKNATARLAKRVEQERNQLWPYQTGQA